VNTIRRPRKRPRVKSCNFRTLGWLIRKVASWQVAGFDMPPWRGVERADWWATIPNDRTDRLARWWIEREPDRRYYP